MTIEQRYLDDFLIGERFAAPPRTLNDSHFVMFSAITGDNHPIHYSVEYAREHDLPGPLAHGLLLLGAGVTFGLVATVFAARAISSLLFGVSATDPLVYTTVTLLLVAVAALANLMPARRAASIDPMQALRDE